MAIRRLMIFVEAFEVHDGWVGGGRRRWQNHRHLCTIAIPLVDMGAQEMLSALAIGVYPGSILPKILLRIFLAFLTCNVLFGDLARSRHSSPGDVIVNTTVQL